ncbi:hypothetical protein SteCoe_34360 [Stentor coeruleus]|uniref:Uncharacterized protein n=1 Tax=Stentor coeruleus TaxID=5963 RepID=A0A1R2AUR3_9CILI|nr:hypothetical protein SteCoe_34360 [Stentor coeruleus]
MQSACCITKRGNTITIPVQAKPNARQSQVTEINSEYVGVSIAAPPQDGEANKELCTFLASILPGVKKRDVSVRPGTQKSRSKLVVVETELNVEQVIQALHSSR